jgi:hypothetical protein
VTITENIFNERLGAERALMIFPIWGMKLTIEQTPALMPITLLDNAAIARIAGEASAPHFVAPPGKSGAALSAAI